MVPMDVYVISPYIGVGVHTNLSQLRKVRWHLYFHEKIVAITDDEYSRLPIYFDHKMADDVSSFPTLFLPLLDRAPSRQIIEDLKKFYLSCKGENVGESRPGG
jgi:hypothetical protein